MKIENIYINIDSGDLKYLYSLNELRVHLVQHSAHIITAYLIYCAESGPLVQLNVQLKIFLKTGLSERTKFKALHIQTHARACTHLYFYLCEVFFWRKVLPNP